LKKATDGDAGVSTNVAYALCIEAEVATGLNSAGESGVASDDGSSKAKRPSNLLIPKEDALWADKTGAELLTQAKLECQKLPSMGLYVVSDADALWKPVLPKEVCQGISHLVLAANSDAITVFKDNLKFVSKAARHATPADYITVLSVDLKDAVNAASGADEKDATATGIYNCLKRKNETGVTWRTDTAKVATNFPANADAVTNLAVADNKTYFEGAAFTGGVYLPVNAETNLTDGSTPKYKLFKAQMDAWVLKRVDVHTKYAAYLVLKEVVTATGQLFRTEIQTVKRN
jgi:hypothetical protein